MTPSSDSPLLYRVPKVQRAPSGRRASAALLARRVATGRRGRRCYPTPTKPNTLNYIPTKPNTLNYVPTKPNTLNYVPTKPNTINYVPHPIPTP